MATTYQLLNVTSEDKQKSQKQKQTYMQEKKNETAKFSEPTDPRGFFLSKLDKARENYIFSNLRSPLRIQ